MSMPKQDPQQGTGTPTRGQNPPSGQNPPGGQKPGSQKPGSHKDDRQGKDLPQDVDDDDEQQDPMDRKEKKDLDQDDLSRGVTDPTRRMEPKGGKDDLDSNPDRDQGQKSGHSRTAQAGASEP